MKPLLCSLLLLFTFSLRAQAPVAVPIPKEPHHHLVFQNDYVRVFRVSVPAHDATLLHQHDVPYIYVSLGPADVVNAVQGKPEVHLVMADGQVGYSPGHFAHIARVESDIPFNNVTIELLKPQGEPRNLCQKIVPGDLGPCKPVRAEGAFSNTSMFATDGMSLDLTELQAGATVNDLPAADKLLVALEKASFLVDRRYWHSTRVSGGDVLWLPGGRPVAFKNESSHPSRMLLLTFNRGASGSTGKR